MSPRRRLSAERKTQILEAAVRVIAERGLGDTRISDIASAAGTSAALVLYYWGSKDKLLAQALTFEEERFYAETAEQLATIPSARGRLIRLIELSCADSGTDPASWAETLLWLEVWARSPRDPDVAKDREALDRRWRETIATIVRDGQVAGEFGSIDADSFALRLAALMDGLSVLVVLGDPVVSADGMRDICRSMAELELGFDATVARR